MPSLADILKLVSQLIDIEKKIEEIIQSEKDKSRKKKIKKAFEKRDLDALRKLILNR